MNLLLSVVSSGDHWFGFPYFLPVCCCCCCLNLICLICLPSCFCHFANTLDCLMSCTGRRRRLPLTQCRLSKLRFLSVSKVVDICVDISLWSTWALDSLYRLQHCAHHWDQSSHLTVFCPSLPVMIYLCACQCYFTLFGALCTVCAFLQLDLQDSVKLLFP